MSKELSVGVVGASGYTGAELLRLLAGHGDLRVSYVSGDSTAGQSLGRLYPSLLPYYQDTTVETFSPDDLEGFDCVFLALPHGESAKVVTTLIDRVGVIVDLSADFRLPTPQDYQTHYGVAHAAPELLSRALLTVPEINRAEITRDKILAVAGCYVTGSSLALYPLSTLKNLDKSSVIVNGASGVSGAGKTPKASSHFAAVDENFTAYSLLSHRHTPEMELLTGMQILFTPHLVPMTRGILSTCYVRTTGPSSTDELLDHFQKFYADEDFVHIIEEPPSTKYAMGSNNVFITARYDDKTGNILVISAIDNLVKGASGQAIQVANIALGLDESSGLTQCGIYP